MHLLPALLLLATSTISATAAPLTKRLTPLTTLTQDITNIHTAVLANTASSQNFHSTTLATTLLSGTPVLTTVAAIHLANRKGYADAALSPALNAADTAALFDHTIATVGVSIPESVKVLEGKEAQFAAAGMRAVVAASLGVLLEDHDSFSAALMAKAYKGDEALTARGVGVVDEIHEAIQGGIDAFSS